MPNRSQNRKRKLKLKRNSVHLPEEIVLDIIYRLPAKSLGRCKCVSKSWRTLISNPNFIQTHLSLSHRRSHKSLLLVQEKSLFVVEFHGESPSGTADIVWAERLNFNQTDDWEQAYCSFNGLVLAINSRYQLFVLNPATLEIKQLPKPYGENLVDSPVLGFGYDSTTDDYKAVVISYPNFVYVYRFKSNTWEMLGNSPLDHGEAMTYNESGVALNGCLHWFGEISWETSTFRIEQQSSISAFDLADEKFREVPLPNQFDRLKTRVLSNLGVVDGCLCIVSQENHYQVNGRVDVWVMKDYGVESSWTKFLLYQDIGLPNPVYFWGNKEFVLITGEAQVAICNVKEESSTDIFIRGIQRGWSAKAAVHCSFVDSLVSPKQLRQGTNFFLT